MNKITITVKDKQKEDIVLNFLHQIPFIDVKVNKEKTSAKSSDFKKLFGIWKNRKIDINDIRSKAWQK